MLNLNDMYIYRHIELNCSLTLKEGYFMVVDRRVRKTQAAIKEAFIHLLEKKT